MKFLIALMALSSTALAQTKEGRVVYERSQKMNFQMDRAANMPPEIRAQMEAQFAKPRLSQFELLFTPQHSLYQYLPSATDDGGNSLSGSGMVIQMRGGGAGEISYTDLATGIRTDQREVMERNFVVTDTTARLKWRLSEETKPILQFTARKATATNVVSRPRMMMENGEMKRDTVTDTVKVIAWYTTDVPVAAGPTYAGQLPGLLLELDVNNGQTLITALEFSPKVAANKIKAPNEGKKLTSGEFNKERDKLMEEMRKNMPAGNVIRM